MNFIKNKLLLFICLTFCWAVLWFKPVYAQIILTGNEHEEGLTIGDGGDNTALEVSDNASTTNVTISDGGSATYSGNSSATDTTVEGGELKSEETSTLIETTINGGNITARGHSEIETLEINGGFVSLEGANVEATGISMTGGNLSVIDNGTIDNISMTGGTLSVINGTTKNSSINTGSMATFENDAKGYNTTIAGGYVEISGSAILDTEDDGTNKIENGDLIIKDSATARNFILEKGNISLSGGTLLNANVTDDFTISVGNNIVPNTASGTIETITVNAGGRLVLYDETGTVGGTINNVTVENGGMLESNYDDNSSFTANDVTINDGGKFILSTNDKIENINTTSSDGTIYNGSITDGSAEWIYVGSDSVFTVKDTDEAKNLTIESGTINVDDGGTLYDSVLESGTASIFGTANNIKFQEDSMLIAQSGSSINNASFLGSSIITIQDYNSLTGTLTVGKDVTGLNVNQLFTEGTGLSNLTLTGGLNSIFASGIINNDSSTDHNLFLEDGSYATTEIKGWKDVKLINAVFTPNNNVILNSGSLNIDESSSLFISGNIAVKNGDINNSGTIDLVANDNTAGNSLTIEGNYTGNPNSKLNLNVDIASAKADKIIITGNASGSTSVYLTSLNDGSSLRDDILFAKAGSTSGENVFKIHRVEGSYYHWDTVFKDNQWFASMKNAISGDKYILVPEAVAYYGLIDNTFMQTSSLGESLRNNIAISEYQKAPCKNIKRGASDICRSNRPVFTGWVAPATTSLTIDSPYVYGADISGFDGGLDLMSNGNTKLGLLASYRKGTYNYDEDGDQYQIIGQAETTINSYLAGAYLRHDGQNWSTILAGYAGMIDADISTNDDVNTSTSGTLYGATLDVSYIYKNISGLRIEPGVRISYTAVEIDPVEDNAGKTQEFDNASRTEIEAGIKFAKRWEFPESRAEIFIKPSIVHIMDDTSEFVIDSENSMAQADDRTIAKISAGMSFDMTSTLSASIAGSYSVGDDYKNTSGSLSVMYKF
ncbi:MAG: autotransporter outer membrane beta-barrel domain-containing protein [Alphaproteobacteria bacterium]|nr:autotransporter outer membrane beta-barrel domain-containing protein [Alphaproteobacteria bacterium]